MKEPYVPDEGLMFEGMEFNPQGLRIGGINRDYNRGF